MTDNRNRASGLFFPKLAMAILLSFMLASVSAAQKDSKGSIVVAVIPPNAERDLKGVAELIANSMLHQLQQSDVAMVEREKIAALLSELELGNTQAGRDSTLKAGRMAGATRLVLGNLRRDTDKQLTWLAKVLDSDTGVLLDLRVIHLPEEDIEKTVNQVTKTIAESVSEKASFSGRYLGIGTFENVSPGGRYATLSDDLRAYLEKNLTNDRVRIVERGFLEALLDEAELYRGGMADGRARAMPIPACCLVTGLYQAHNDGEDQVILNLRISNIGSTAVVKSIEKKAGEALYSAVAEAISESLEKAKTEADFNSKIEAAEHHKRGVYLSDIGYANASYPKMNGIVGRRSGGGGPKLQRLNIYGAIQEFRAALLLDPTLVETRLFLAICLRYERKYERAVKRLNEVVAMAPESKMAVIARRSLARLEATDRRDRVRRLLAFRATIKDKEHLAVIDSSLADAARSKDFTLEESTEYFTRAAISLIELAKATGQFRVSSLTQYNSLRVSTRVNEDKKEWHKQYQVITDAVRKHDPTFAPYLEATILVEHMDRIPDWKDRIDAMLTTCEKDPKSVFKIEVFARAALWRLILAVSRKGDPERVIRIGEFCLKNSGNRKRWKGPTHRLTCETLIGSYFDKKQWAKAMPLCELYSPVETQNYCREQMGLKVSDQPKPKRLEPSRKVKLPELHPNPKIHPKLQSILLVEKDAAYLFTELGIHKVALPSKESRLVIPSEKITADITDIRCTRRAGNVIWLGTVNGIYACNDATGDVRHYTVNDDGLPFAEVTCLTVMKDKVWFGFQKRQHGGVGYIDRNSGSFVNLYPKLKEGVMESASYETRPENPHDEAPRLNVTGIAHCSEDAVYVAVSRKGVQRYDLKTAKWSTIFVNQDVRTLAAVPGSVGFSTSTLYNDPQSVFLYDVQTKTVTALDEKKHGYQNQTTGGMVGFQGHFWVATGHGIFVIDAITKRCRWHYEGSSYSTEFSELGNEIAWWSPYNGTEYGTFVVGRERE